MIKKASQWGKEAIEREENEKRKTLRTSNTIHHGNQFTNFLMTFKWLYGLHFQNSQSFFKWQVLSIFVVVVVLKPLLLLVYQGFLYYLFIFLMLNLFLFIWFIQDTFCPSEGISLTASIGHFIDIWWPHTHTYTSLSYSSDLMTICLSKVGNLLLTLRFFFSSSKSSKGMSISFP